MCQNPWISNYLSHVKLCGQGLGSDPHIRPGNHRLLQKRALSFHREFNHEEEKEAVVRSITDIDVSLLAALPKVSELRKRFEGIHTSISDWDMNRKERIARRLEGIESGDVPPSLLPSMVAHRLLEEDTPRYTRSSEDTPRYARNSEDTPLYIGMAERSPLYTKTPEDTRRYVQPNEEALGYIRTSADPSHYIRKTQDTPQYSRGTENASQYTRGLENASQYSRGTENASQYSRGLENASQYSRGLENASQYSRGTENASQYSRGTENASQYSRGTENTSQYSRGTENASQYSRGTENDSQYSRGTEDTSQYSRGTENASQYSRGTENASQYRRGTENASQYSRGTEDTSQYSRGTENASQYSSRTEVTPQYSHTTEEKLYSRSSEPHEPGTVTSQRNSKDSLHTPEQQQQKSEPQSAPQIPVYSSSVTTDGPQLESKAQRIARYKAERRRQLAERYGISLDLDTDTGYTSRYTRPRREQERPSQPPPPALRKDALPPPTDTLLQVRQAPAVIRLGSFITFTVSRMWNIKAYMLKCMSVPPVSPESTLTRVDSFAERERLLNLENQRRTAPVEQTSAYMEVTPLSPSRAPNPELSQSSMVPSSWDVPKQTSVSSSILTSSWDVPKETSVSSSILTSSWDVPKQTSVSSSILTSSWDVPKQTSVSSSILTSSWDVPKQTSVSSKLTSSSGDMLIDQQPQAVLSRQGVRTRERLIRGVNRQTSSDQGPNSELVMSRKHTQTTTHPHHTTVLPLPPAPEPAPDLCSTCPTYLSMSSRPTLTAAPQEEAPDRGEVKTEGLLRSRKAVLPSEIFRHEKTNEEPKRGHIEEQLGPRSQSRETEVRSVHVSRERSPNRRDVWDPQVSVSQLRNSYMESTSTSPGTRRAPKSCVSSDFTSTEGDEETLDERAKLSVAAKRSLFRELEKSVEVPKGLSRKAVLDRRLRRGQDRSRTQPVTTEEVVIAATDPCDVLQPGGALTSLGASVDLSWLQTQDSLQAASQRSAPVRDVLQMEKVQTVLMERQQDPLPRSQPQTQLHAQPHAQTQTLPQTQPQSQPHTHPNTQTQPHTQPHSEPQIQPQTQPHTHSSTQPQIQPHAQPQIQEEPDLCTLSLAEKMELFNRLARPPTRVVRTRGDPRNRRANARYQTQPITQEDMQQLQSGHSVVQSFPSAGTVSTSRAGDIQTNIRRPAQKLLDPPLDPPTELPTDPPTELPIDPPSRPQQASHVSSGDKRKRSSPEGGVRQPALPQPQPLSMSQPGREAEGRGQEEESYRAEPKRDVPIAAGTEESQSGRRACGGLLDSSQQLPQAVPPPHRRGQSSEADSATQPEEDDQPSETRIARHMSIKERVALLKRSGEDDWRSRINRKQEVTPVAHGNAQILDEEMKEESKDQPCPRPVQAEDPHPWRRKRAADMDVDNQPRAADMDVDSQPVEMSIQERKQLICAREEAWKSSGHGAANDSTQFTVAARMVKKGLASPSALQSAAPAKPKNNCVAISKPQEDEEEMLPTAGGFLML
ncbi:hypothetical protein WMY93_029781 [Mugilogobius chulae]|uniref:Supervillin n=1 Tax=Mugilogobius chulae TaxID=88201 RepID=A0AAW0MKU0_9GOBI